MDHLHSYRSQFARYRHLGAAAMEQLSWPELTHDAGDGTNPITVIVKHLAGNMHSRWTDLLTTDGEKSWRDRDREFIDDYTDYAALLAAWDGGWAVLEQTLAGLTPTDLDRTVFIRGEAHTVYAAIDRQLAHYSYHVGQIVLLARQRRGRAWRSLSIPKGESRTYNKRKFGELP